MFGLSVSRQSKSVRRLMVRQAQPMRTKAAIQPQLDRDVKAEPQHRRDPVANRAFLPSMGLAARRTSGIALGPQPHRQQAEQAEEPQHRIGAEQHHIMEEKSGNAWSGLFQFNKHAAEIFWMKEQHRLAVCPDLDLGPKPRAPAAVIRPWAALYRRLRSRHDGCRLRDAFEEIGDGRIFAQRRQELDLAAGQLHEHGGDAMLGLRRKGAETFAPRVSRYSAVAFSRSRVAMAT